MNPYKLIIIIFSFLISTKIYAENLVRIEIPENGIYGIGYSTLREMGFSNPEEVGIYGRGGKKMPIENDVNPVMIPTIIPAVYTDNKIIFYGNGPEDITFNEKADLPTGGYFKNNGRNVMTNSGIYFLSDKPGIKKEMVMTAAPGTADGEEEITGITYIYHESELEHNHSNTGNIFWGEILDDSDNKEQSWKISTPDALSDKNSYFSFDLFTERNISCNVRFGNKTTGSEIILEKLRQTSTNLLPISGIAGDIAIKNGENNLYINYSSGDNNVRAHLDFWIMTYSTDCSPALSGQTNSVVFPSLKSGKTYIIPFSNKDVWGIDISENGNPTLLARNNDESGSKIFLGEKLKTPEVIFFNRETGLKSIGKWEKLDLNAGDTGWLRDSENMQAELLIISTEELKDYAEMIADIHRESDGIEVTVATIENIYREFSEGLPDPEAYRRIASLYKEKGRLENLLIVGEITNNIRQHTDTYGYAKAHIAPQSGILNREYGAPPVLDYYGVTTPDFTIDHVENGNMTVGIGVLPFRNKTEAANYVKKLTRYYNNNQQLQVLNEWLFIGGTGDDHTHALQSLDLAEYVNKISDNRTINSLLILDAYGYREAFQKFKEYLSSGKCFITYIGHSAHSMFEQNNKFFNTADISSLGNTVLPFLFTAGCNTSGTDFGIRGMAEEFALCNQSGTIGSLASLRETWSNQNFDYAKILMSNLTRQSNVERGETIGQIIANSKNEGRKSNNLAYVLICDPAIRLGLPKPGMEIEPVKEIIPGKQISLKGKILSPYGNDDENFDGTIAVKIVLPEISLESNDLITGKKETNPLLDIKYADRIFHTSFGEIKNGNFEINLQAPYNLNQYSGDECSIYLSAHDRGTDKSFSLSHKVKIGTADESVGILPDMEGPSIEEFYYDPVSSEIRLTAYDDSGLIIGGGALKKTGMLWINGRKTNMVMAVNEVIDQGKRAKYSSVMPKLPDGLHTIKVNLVDIHGNQTYGEITVNIGASYSDLSLSLTERVVDKMGEFEISGDYYDTKIIILNSEGGIVKEIESNGNSVSWDRTDNAGNKVINGIYRAYVSDKVSKEGIKRQSKIIRVPVI